MNLKQYFGDAVKKVRRLDSPKEKLEYIWQYFYLWIIGFVAGVLFLIFFINRFFFTVKENWIYVMFNNTYAEVGDHSDLWDGYVEYTGYDLKEKNVVFNNSSYFDYKDNVTGNTYFESFVAYTETGTLDAITMPADSLIALGESGRLMDLESEEYASIREKYGDRFLYCEPFDEDYGKDQVAVGIDISDSILMTGYHIYPDSCAIGIGSGSVHTEAVEAFLDYIFSE